MERNLALRLEDARRQNQNNEDDERYDDDDDEDDDEDEDGDEEEDDGDEFDDEYQDQILFREDGELNILTQNEQLWRLKKDHLVNLNARGYLCAGPGIGSFHFIFEECPTKTAIDFDIALLRRSRDRRLPTLSLDSRCVDCHSEMRIREIIKNFDSPIRDKEMSLDTPRTTFARSITKTWTCSEDYKKNVQVAVKESRVNGQLGPRVLIMDVEFSPTTWELYEVAIIDRVSGETLLNTLISHKDKYNTRNDFRSRRTQKEKIALITYFHKKKVYKRSEHLGEMTVDQVAERLQELKITKDNIFQTWHISRNDLSILRKFLVEGGYPSILSNDQPCYPMVPIFRKNFPGMSFPLALEVMFPVMFPDSDLRGRNHQAWVDCKQTLLVCDAFDALLDPVEIRSEEWLPAKFENEPQRSIPAKGSIQNYFSPLRK
ncbi:hypothetical protein ACHAPQ_009895 [Fusarium lateritium]